MKIVFRKFFAIAAVTALLIGARFPQNSSAQTESAPSAATDNSTEAPTSGDLPADVAPGSPLAQAIQMAQSGVDASVIKSYVENSTSPFNLTSDQIIYLKDLGLPNDVVTAMIQRDQQLGATAAAQTPQQPSGSTTEVATEEPEAVTQNYFYDTLSPYGGWVNVEGYGLCWRPTIVTYQSGWQPYCDHGHWVYTDSGWYWISDYAWGATAFHYGRWFHDAHQGWCWWPDTTWGPSWVCWRYSNDYCGWAPLPPRCTYRPGVGMFYNGVAVGAGFNFGISANFFTFVPTGHFNDPHPRRFRVASGDAAKIYGRTTVANNFGVNRRDRTMMNNGIPPERIQAITRKPIQQLTIRETTGAGAHQEQLERNAVVIHRPGISANAAEALNKGVRPPVIHRNAPPQIRNENPRAPVPQNRSEQPQSEPRAPTPNYNSENSRHAMSPRQQQKFEEQPPRPNPHTFNQPQTFSAPAERPQAEPRQNYSAPAPRVSPPQSRPSAPPPAERQSPPQHSGNKDQNH